LHTHALSVNFPTLEQHYSNIANIAATLFHFCSVFVSGTTMEQNWNKVDPLGTKIIIMSFGSILGEK
jgi:hypothetical protein